MSLRDIARIAALEVRCSAHESVIERLTRECEEAMQRVRDLEGRLKDLETKRGK